jgi:hypothetical protein
MNDFDALAAVLGAGIADLRGCLILSRDGLVLAGYPDTAEQELKAPWRRFAALGEPDRGFVQFGNETWCYARRGPYGSFAVTGIGVRPGIVIDHMEQVLLAAEDERSKGEGVKGASVPVPSPQAAGGSGKRKKRTSLHGDPAPIKEPVVIHAEAPAAQAASAARPPVAEAGEESFEDPGEPEPVAGPSSGGHEEPARADPAVGPEDPGDEDEVDRFSLAAEFSRLLQDKRDDADG